MILRFSKVSIPVILGLFIFTACTPKKSIVDRGLESQTLHVGNGAEPQELDPHIITGISEIKILSALFEGLVGQNPEDLSPVPGSAETWNVSADGKTYTFHLHPDLEWSNGDPLTANDYAFSFQRMLQTDLGAPNAYLLFILENAQAYHIGKTDFDQVGVTVIDDHTLELQLENPTPYFLNLLSHPAWYPVHKDTLSKSGNPLSRASGWTRPGTIVSNGPFKLKDWRVNEFIIVESNEKYWDKDTVRLKQIWFYPTESRFAEERMFRNGQLHITEAMPTALVKQYRNEQNPALQIDPYLGTFSVQLNTLNPPLEDPRVRKALSLVIDRQQIVDTVTQGDQQPAWNFTPPGTNGFIANIPGEKNIEQARKLLAEAGYPEGKGFPEFTYLYNTSENNKAIAETLQQMWNTTLGIHIKLENQEWKVFTQTRETGGFDLLRSSWIGDYLDPNTFMDVWTSSSGNNFTGWSSAEYDELIRHAGIESNVTKRFALFQAAEVILNNEQPIIPLYFYTSVYLKHKTVKGYHPTLLNLHPWKHVYLEN